MGWIPDRFHCTNDVTIDRQMSPSSAGVSGLFTWRATVAVEAPPTEVLSRLVADRGRSKWDSEVGEWRTSQKLESSIDVVEYSWNVGELDRLRHVCLLRLAEVLFLISKKEAESKVGRMVFSFFSAYPAQVWIAGVYGF